jgi:aryl-alcohol dehydrogenase-like predicted oxidoreductase
VLERGEAISALERARERGKTRYVGYSGDGAAAKFAIECGRFQTLQTSVSVADQESIDRLLPLARARGVGVIAKRPVANVAWKSGKKPPESAYHQTYWERLAKLDYDFVKKDVAGAVAVALGFTLAMDGVHTAIVGTTKPGRFAENAAVAAKGPLAKDEVEKIRARWKAVAKVDWGGQT